ncbi:hypothetical protein [Rheinheimera texasensis]|uniref:hypothetical protein n=1 Tax=Rheinheimera texasensis TaxID=306205 RepID=UPI0032B2909B
MRKWLLLMALIITPAQAQTDEVNTDEWGMRGQYQRMFNPKTIQTVHGQILAVEPFSLNNRMCNGLHIKLRTAATELIVHLGPKFYVEDQPITLAYGMQVSATGSMIQYLNAPAMIATEINTEHGVLKLRSADGIPYWSRRMTSDAAVPYDPQQKVSTKANQNSKAADGLCTDQP